MQAMIQSIKGLTAGGKLALILSCLWVFSLAACGYGGGCIPGGGAKLPTPAPAKPPRPVRVVKVTLQKNRIEMPHVMPPGPTLFKITNHGSLANYLEIERQGTEVRFGLDLMPGSTKELQINLESGRYRVWRPFEGNTAKGMELEVDATPSQAPAYPY